MVWLFPAWLRETRGEEAIALVLDLAPANETSLPLRSRLDLIRAGLHARRVGTPPLGVWQAVAWAHRRNRSGMVPDQWRPWLLDGLGRQGFLLRLALLRSIVAMGPSFGLSMAWWSFSRAARGVVSCTSRMVTDKTASASKTPEFSWTSTCQRSRTCRWRPLVGPLLPSASPSWRCTGGRVSSAGSPSGRHRSAFS